MVRFIPAALKCGDEPRSGWGWTAGDPAPHERGDAARNRALLLDAARRLIAERGADAVSMDDIAAAAGVGKGTLFRRFGSRAGLMMVLLDEDERASQEAFLFGPPPLGPEAPPLERLLAFGRERLRFAHTHHALLSSANRDPQSRYSAPAMLLHTHVRLLLDSAGTTGRPRRADRCTAGAARCRLCASSARRPRRNAARLSATSGRAWRASSAASDTDERLRVGPMTHGSCTSTLTSSRPRSKCAGTPNCEGLPIIVGGNGDPTEPRKVVTCASYPGAQVRCARWYAAAHRVAQVPGSHLPAVGYRRLRRGVRRSDEPVARLRPPGRSVGLGRGLRRR